jgi:ketosteroid isomerase-like protein
MSHADSTERHPDHTARPLDVIRSVYALVGTGDLPGVLALVAEDVVVTQAAALPFGGTWHGKSAFMDMAGQIVGDDPSHRI